MNIQFPPVAAVRTTCPYCGVGCGILAQPDGRGGVAISGDPLHPANHGRLCSKGAALGETLSPETRLLHPMLRQPDSSYRECDWDTALDRVADGFRRIVEREGPDAVAFYLSGQLLTEDYYVANKLMKGFIGSANVDTNSRLCMASSVAGHRRAFGADTVPCCYEDIDRADLITLVGSNAAWCHPVLFQRMTRSRTEHGAKIVVIDPRRTATADEADLFLPIASGMDTVLFSGLFVFLAEQAAIDGAYVNAHTTGFDGALARARQIAPTLEAVASRTKLAADDVLRFYELFRSTERALTCFSQGVNQSAQGTDKVNAIINCHLATGRIGRPGKGPFSLTGQPNAMGGREAGGLANQLAAHMSFTPDEIDRVRRFWRAPRMAEREGLKAVDLFQAIERGTIKALWVIATNPAVSLPRAAAVRAALARLELFVVSENVRNNDTVGCGAHILLPAAAWGEKDGTVTNSERRISRQRAFQPAPGDAKPDWWIVAQVGARMGFGEAFDYSSPADVFREHAALSAFENAGERDFNLEGLAAISDEEFNRLEPKQWPVRAGAKNGTARLFANGGFFTPQRKARFIAPESPDLKERTTSEFPLLLNTGRIRDQWHTMTRTGLSPRLSSHLPEPFVEIHPDDAAAIGAADGGFARVATRHGSGVFRVRISPGQHRGSVFIPIHWSATTASSARAGDLVAQNTDPFSGQPETKATPASVEPIAYRLCGFVISRRSLTLPAGTWWSRVALVGGWGLLLATDSTPSFWQVQAASMFAPEAEFAEYMDERAGIYRLAAFVAGRLEGCLFVGPAEDVPNWDALKALFESEAIEERARRMILSGRSHEGIADSGPIVCACFGVGLAAIRDAIRGGAADVDAIGRSLRAGTNCGSCVPELRRIVHDAHVPSAV